MELPVTFSKTLRSADDLLTLINSYRNGFVVCVCGKDETPLTSVDKLNLYGAQHSPTHKGSAYPWHTDTFPCGEGLND